MSSTIAITVTTISRRAANRRITRTCAARRATIATCAGLRPINAIRSGDGLNRYDEHQV